jgi:hypothetical protein
MKHMSREYCEISTGNCGKLLRESKWYFQLTVVADSDIDSFGYGT